MLSFDHLGPFRRNPSLYFLVGLICSGLGLLLVVGIFISSQHDSFSKKAETPAQKEDRLAIMNILNKFQLAEGGVSTGATFQERLAMRRTHIADVLSGLKVLQADGTIQKSQRDIINLFSEWDRYLEDRQDTQQLRGQFIALGSAYPWLSTLMWLIVLNRL